MIRFETERLILRNYTMDDAPAVHEYLSNEEVSRYEDFWPLTIEEVTEGLSEWKDMDNRMAVVLKETGELIGSVGYWDDEEDEDGETEYSIDFDFNPRFWHKGYAFEAAKEVVRHLTEDLHVKEIYGDCDERNIASAKLMERLGFRLMDIVDDAYKEDADGNPIMIRSKEYKLTGSFRIEPNCKCNPFTASE
jgi:ribosomal-protein-alanine N-acetyltransferase